MARLDALTRLMLSALFLPFSLAVAYDRAACQSPSQDSLQGCPKNTLLVGATEKFTSVQDAVLSIPDNDVPYTILILPGSYREQVNVTRHGPLTLLGQTGSPNDANQNAVNIVWYASQHKSAIE